LSQSISPSLSPSVSPSMGPIYPVSRIDYTRIHSYTRDIQPRVHIDSIIPRSHL
jgi:hypothetical protein